MITINDIQNKLAEAIKQSGLSQTFIGAKIGVSQQTISHYIKGDKMPALDTLANLCDLLNLDANDILCIAEYKPKEKTYNNFGIHTGDVKF